MVLVSLSILFILIYGFLMYYYVKGWNRLDGFHQKPSVDHFISLVIAARNEEKNITALLNAIQKQSYPLPYFEVIVVDDFSTDDTRSVVMAHPLSNLILIQPEGEASQSSKKKAIATGISHAKGELIITTDADCLPGKKWLEVVNSFYSEKNASFIAAPVQYQHNGSLFEIFQALDFMTLQGITAASAGAGFHFMCNGANLAYKRSSFNLVNGFESIDKVATGDDMLLMHKISKAEPGKVFYLKNKEAIVHTQPMKTWKDFLMQRRRWASKTLVYEDKKIIMILALVYLVNCLFIVLLIAAIANSVYWWLVLFYLLAKTIIEYPFINKVAGFYKEKKLLPYFFLLQPVHIIYTIIAGTLSQFGRYEWKGRKTK